MCRGLAVSASERWLNACGKNVGNLATSFVRWKLIYSSVSRATQLVNDFGLGVFETHLTRLMPLQLSCCASALWLGVVQSGSLVGLSTLPLCVKCTLFFCTCLQITNIKILLIEFVVALMCLYPLAYNESATESAWKGRLIMLQNGPSTVCFSVVSASYRRLPVGSVSQRLLD